MAEYEYDYSFLRGKIKEKVGTECEFAKRIKRSQNYVSSVFRGNSYFRANDIVNAANVLGIAQEEIGKFFYTQKVHANAT